MKVSNKCKLKKNSVVSKPDVICIIITVADRCHEVLKIFDVNVSNHRLWRNFASCLSYKPLPVIWFSYRHDSASTWRLLSYVTVHLKKPTIVIVVMDCDVLDVTMMCANFIVELVVSVVLHKSIAIVVVGIVRISAQKFSIGQIFITACIVAKNYHQWEIVVELNGSFCKFVYIKLHGVWKKRKEKQIRLVQWSSSFLFW